jgi:hypothetical protein
MGDVYFKSIFRRKNNDMNFFLCLFFVCVSFPHFSVHHPSVFSRDCHRSHEFQQSCEGGEKVVYGIIFSLVPETEGRQ